MLILSNGGTMNFAMNRRFSIHIATMEKSTLLCLTLVDEEIIVHEMEEVVVKKEEDTIKLVKDAGVTIARNLDTD